MPNYDSKFAVGSSSCSGSGSYDVIDRDRNRTSPSGFQGVIDKIWQGLTGQGGGRVPAYAVPCYSQGGVVDPSRLLPNRSGFSMPPDMLMALLNGGRSRQGVVVLRALRSKNLIEQLAEHLSRTGAGVGLGGGVTLHGISSSLDCAPAEGFEVWTALVSVETRTPLGRASVDTFSVPLTDIEELSFEKSAPSNWEHVGLKAHIEQLAAREEEATSAESGLQLPSFWVQPNGKRTPLEGRGSGLLENAYVFCRAARQRGLELERGERALRRSNSQEYSRHPYADFPSFPEEVFRGPLSARSAPKVASRPEPRPAPPVSRPKPQASGSRPLWLSKLGGVAKQGLSTIQPRPRPIPRPTQRPTQMPISSRVSMFVPNPKVLTLKGAHPLNEGLPVGQAYRFAQAYQHCGVAAINGFYQNEVVRSEHAARLLIDSHLELIAPEHLSRLPGLFHPRVVRAMQEGKAVEISRREFFGEFAADGRAKGEAFELLDQLYSQGEQWAVTDTDRVEAQWQSFFSFDYAQGNEFERGDPHTRIQITPESWVAVFGGMGLEHLEGLMNQLLAKKGPSNGPWGGYPKKVGTWILAPNRALREGQYQALEQALTQHKAKQLICMTDGGLDAHYFTLIQDKAGNWLKLDAMDFGQSTGMQRVPVFARRGELANQLAQESAQGGVSHVLCDEKVVHAVRF